MATYIDCGSAPVSYFQTNQASSERSQCTCSLVKHSWDNIVLAQNPLFKYGEHKSGDWLHHGCYERQQAVDCFPLSSISFKSETPHPYKPSTPRKI